MTVRGDGMLYYRNSGSGGAGNRAGGSLGMGRDGVGWVLIAHQHATQPVSLLAGIHCKRLTSQGTRCARAQSNIT